MPADRLPPAPNLEFYKKQAKALRQGIRQHSPEALACVRAHLPAPQYHGPEAQ